MKMQYKDITTWISVLATLLIMSGCAPAEGEYGGSEYVPDMGHSVAMEANLYSYYGPNTWDESSTVALKDLAYPRQPVAGTIPRGAAGVHYAQGAQARKAVEERLLGNDALHAIRQPGSAQVPYYYEDSDSARQLAIREIIDNPYPITAAGLARGKDLYNIYCGICHGEKADGQGYLVSEDNKNAKYLAQPANFLLDEMVDTSNGYYYHTIMHGKNVMGPYRDKLNYQERWEVIHYIRSLQAKEKKLVYSEEKNTLNPAAGIPAAVASEYAKLQSPIDIAPENAPGADTTPGQGTIGLEGVIPQDFPPDNQHEEDHDGGHH